MVSGVSWVPISHLRARESISHNRHAPPFIALLRPACHGCCGSPRARILVAYGSAALPARAQPAPSRAALRDARPLPRGCRVKKIPLQFDASLFCRCAALRAAALVATRVRLGRAVPGHRARPSDSRALPCNLLPLLCCRCRFSRCISFAHSTRATPLYAPAPCSSWHPTYSRWTLHHLIRSHGVVERADREDDLPAAD